MSIFHKKIEEKNKKDQFRKLLFEKTMKLFLDVNRYTFDNIFKFYDKIEDFLKEDFEYSVSIQNFKVIELIISKNNKSVCFEINEEDEVKNTLTWACIKKQLYGFAEVKEINEAIWEWLEREI